VTAARKREERNFDGLSSEKKSWGGVDGEPFRKKKGRDEKPPSLLQVGKKKEQREIERTSLASVHDFRPWGKCRRGRRGGTIS